MLITLPALAPANCSAIEYTDSPGWTTCVTIDTPLIVRATSGIDATRSTFDAVTFEVAVPATSRDSVGVTRPDNDVAIEGDEVDTGIRTINPTAMNRAIR